MDLWKVVVVQDKETPGFELLYSDGGRAQDAFDAIEANAGETKPVVLTDDYSSTISLRRDDWRFVFMQNMGEALEIGNLLQLQQLRAQRRGQKQAEREAREDGAIIPVAANAVPPAILKPNGGNR